MIERLISNRLVLITVLLGVASLLLIFVVLMFYIEHFHMSNALINVSETVDWLIEKSENDDPYFVFGLAFLPAILTISYPFIIQIISNLNSLYGSTHIVDQFNEEPFHILFKRFLWIAVFVAVLSVFGLRIFLFLSLITDIVLIWIFFKYSNLLLTYTNGQKLFAYFNNSICVRDRISNKLQPSEIQLVKNLVLAKWEPMFDLFFYSAEQKDHRLNDEIFSSFIVPSFYLVRDYEFGNMELARFPDEFYNRGKEAILRFSSSKIDNFFFRPSSFLGTLYFPNSYKNESQYIHSDTYQILWWQLVLLIESDKDKQVFSYWGSAHQFFSSYAREPQRAFDKDFIEISESIEARKRTTKHSSLFKQFHVVLGAHLYYKKKYDLLKKVWMYSSSYPPRYLLTSNIDDIFNTYRLFRFDNYLITEGGFATRYWFNDFGMEEMNQPNDVMRVVRKYCTLLLLRFWKFSGENIRDYKPSMPAIPQSQSQKREFQEQLSFFRTAIQEQMLDHELLDSLTLPQFKDKYYASRVLEYVDGIRNRLKEDFVYTIQHQELDLNKIAALDAYAVETLKTVYKKIRRISGNEVPEDDMDSISKHSRVIRGQYYFVSREAFVKNTSVHYSGFGEAMVDGIKSEYMNHVLMKFFTNKSVTYEIPFEDIFKAIDKLRLDPKLYVIVSFNINFQNLVDYRDARVEEKIADEDYRYESIPIYELEGWLPNHNGALYVLKRSDFPMMIHKDWSEIEGLDDEVKERWRSMTRIDAELKLYRKIVDYANEDNLANYDQPPAGEHQDNDPKIKIDFDFIAYCWFKKDVKIVEIHQGYQFQEGGIKNSVDDIKPM